MTSLIERVNLPIRGTERDKNLIGILSKNKGKTIWHLTHRAGSTRVCSAQRGICPLISTEQADG